MWRTQSERETFERGREIARTLRPGMCVALVGELGSGKTVLVKGIARGLHTKNGKEVRSPTFVLLRVYRGRIPLNHFDFYRLEPETDLEEIGLYEYLLDPQAVSVVEWADRVPGVFREADLIISLRVLGEQTRRIDVKKM